MMPLSTTDETRLYDDSCVSCVKMVCGSCKKGSCAKCKKLRCDVHVKQKCAICQKMGGCQLDHIVEVQIWADAAFDYLDMCLAEFMTLSRTLNSPLNCQLLCGECNRSKGRWFLAAIKGTDISSNHEPQVCE